MKNNDVINWDFKTLANGSDYLLTFDMKANNKMFNMLLNKAKTALKRKGKDFKETYIDAFDIEERFLNLLHTILVKRIKEVSQEVGKDGIILLNSRVEHGRFTRRKDSDGWDIKIKVGGQYGRK